MSIEQALDVHPDSITALVDLICRLLCQDLRSWTSYASPLYSYTSHAPCLSASHNIQPIQRPYSPYSIQLYSPIYTLPLWEGE